LSEEVIANQRRHETDTGSPEVQVANITNRLSTLAEHFAKHPGDKHSKRGLLNLVSQRKRLLNYLRAKDVTKYRETLTALGLRK